MTAPNIESSTREERLDDLYADFIDGKRSYMDITLEIRSNK